MAIEFNPASRTLPRSELSRFLPTDRAVRAFEDLVLDMTKEVPRAFGGFDEELDSIKASPVVLWQASDTFSSGRVIAGGAGIRLNITDTGAVISLSETGVMAGVYGSEAEVVSLQVDGYGRLLAVQAHALVSDNVAEGEENLFFTEERVRGALSAGDGIAYDSVAGEMAVDDSVARTSGEQTLTEKTLDQLRTTQTPTPGAAAVTHKVAITLNGATYYMLLSNV